MGCNRRRQLLLLLRELVLPPWKSTSTVLLHLGHLGSFSESMTYMRQRGHPASTIDDVASGLSACFCSSSDDTHELGGDTDGDEDESSSSSDTTTALVDGPPLALTCFPDRFSFSSTFGFFPWLRLISSLL
ncbi:hypothetical protein BHE74_00047410 [Ensete ventricosum]|nr:hypothetical protein BHE74_00047410 [Ensete ventricosum]RZS01874.1 hypothetical protein BHM03_00031815 [Ensete ventricosum]